MTLQRCFWTRGFLLLLVALGLIVNTAVLAGETPGAAYFWTIAQGVEPDSASGSWLVGNTEGFVIRVRVDDQTTVLDAAGDPVAPDQVPTGAVLYVKAEWTDQGLLAKFVSLSESGGVTVTGAVEKIGAGQLVVAGIDFALADFASANGLPVVGDVLSVQAIVGANGALQVTGIQPLNNIKLSGKIETIEATNGEALIGVATKVVRVTAETSIVRRDGVNMTLADLAVGLYVDVLGQMSSGDILARKIVAADPKRVTVTGVVTAFDATSVSLRAADQTMVVKVDAQTKVAGTLAVGATVSVEAVLQPDASLLALSIRVKGESDPAKSAVRGPIASRGTDFIVVSGVTVKADPALVITSPSAQQVRFSDLKVGDLVEVWGTKQADGSILAVKIALLPPAPPPGVKGAITALGPDFFMMGSVKVLVNDKTVFRSKEASLKFSDLKVGDQVVAQGAREADGSILAQTVELVRSPSDQPYASARGAIASIGSDSFVIGSLTIKVDQKTTFRAGEQQIGFKDLKVGDWVEVGGIRQPDGTLLAGKVTVGSAPPPSNTAVVEGAIESLGTDYLVVKGLKILVTEKTVIREGDRFIRFTDLKTGSSVTVGYTKQGDTMTALKIQVRPVAAG